MDFETRYIGDGVYAFCDGYHIILDLRGQDNTTRIALEPSVFDALIKYRDDLIKAENIRADAAQTDEELNHALGTPYTVTKEV